MKGILRRSLLLAGALVAAACADRAQTVAAEPLVRDSAGITIVENAAPRWGEGEGWRVSDEPVLEIGVVDGPEEYQFHILMSPRRLADGRVVLVNAGTAELRFYDPDGRHIHSVGGDGEAPGEYRVPVWVRILSPDSLLVYDQQLRRASLLDGEGRYRSSFVLESPGDGGWPVAWDAFADGSTLVIAGQPVTPEGPRGVRRDTTALFRYEPGARHHLGNFPWAERFTYSAGGRPEVASRVFSPWGTLAAHGDRWVVGFSETYEFRRYHQAGELELIVRRDVEPVQVTEADVRAYREQALEQAGEGRSEVVQRRLEAMPYPETMPAYARLFTDDAGHVWVREYRPLAVGTGYDVFDPDGFFLGTIELPERFSPTHFGDAFVLGVYRDEFDVEYVRMYALDRTGV